MLPPMRCRELSPARRTAPPASGGVVGPVLRHARLASLVTSLAVAALTGVSCGPAPTAGGFDSPEPAARLYAIEAAARTRDVAAVPQLIESLQHDDPVVCLAADEALRRISGTDCGYRTTESPMEREAAIDRWVEYATSKGWLEGGSAIPTGARSMHSEDPTS